MGINSRIATAIRSGLSVSKPSSPFIGQTWAATDTGHWFLCLSAGVWTDMGLSSSSPGGSNTQVQYNNNGAFGGVSGATTNGTTLTLTTPTLVGRTDGGTASAGNIGEFSQTLVAPGSAVSLTTATAADVATLSLTAGSWDIFAVINFTLSSTVVSGQIKGGVSTTLNTLPVNDGISQFFAGVPVGTFSETISVDSCRIRVNISSSTTYHLVAIATFTGGTVTVFGAINANRTQT